MIEIKAENIDGIEYLPDPSILIDTDITMTKGVQLRNFNVYKAIQEVENYYQVNTPTPFGDPDYRQKQGFMLGLLTAYGLNIDYIEDIIEVSTIKGTKIMRIQKPLKPDSYYDDIKDIRETINNIF